MTPLHCIVFFLSCGCFLQAKSQTGQILPPQNLSLLWICDFNATLVWAPPPKPFMENCTFEVALKTNKSGVDIRKLSFKAVSWTFYTVMEGGYLHLSAQTICNDRHSEAAVLSVTYPEMVKNVHCYISPPDGAHCSWDLADPMPLVRFYYRLSNEDGSASVNDTPPPLQECHTYTDAKGRSAGCHLPANVTQVVYILFNGTANEKYFRNTFTRWLIKDVRLPALNWTVEKTADKFHISWVPPEFKNNFKHYSIDYTECNREMHSLQIHDIERTSAQLDVIRHCQYNMTVRSVHAGFSTQPSEAKYFEADDDRNAWIYVCAVIPLILAVLVILILVYYRRNRDRIFPKVPQPRDLLSDISGNNKSNLHISAQDVENCKIMLVMDSEVNTTVH